MDTSKDIEILILSRSPLIYIETWEEERAEQILAHVSQKLSLPLFIWTPTKGLQNVKRKNKVYKTELPGVLLDFIDNACQGAIYLLKDFHHNFANHLVIRKLKDMTAKNRPHVYSIVFCASEMSIPHDLQKEIKHIKIKLPAKEELQSLLDQMIKDMTESFNIKVEASDNELDRLVDGLKGLTFREAQQAISQAMLRGHKLTIKDYEHIIEGKKKTIEREGILEYRPAHLTMADVGGMDNLKNWLAKRKDTFSKQARDFGLDPPKGILMLGIQGCGKSLFAKATAKELGLPLLKLDPSRIYDKFVGETEKRLKKAIDLAEAMAPVVLWIDEIEKQLPNTRSSDADAGLSKRVLGSFLTWLQDRQSPVFVVATTNDISALPPELLRKGRFDEIFFVGLPDPKQRIKIFSIHLKKRKRKLEGFGLEALAKASEGFSGAEIEQAIVAALYDAFSKRGVLSTKLILKELKSTAPLSKVRKEDIQALKDWAKGRTVAA